MMESPKEEVLNAELNLLRFKMHESEGGLVFVNISMTKIITQVQALMRYRSWVATRGPSNG